MILPFLRGLVSEINNIEESVGSLWKKVSESVAKLSVYHRRKSEEKKNSARVKRSIDMCEGAKSIGEEL